MMRTVTLRFIGGTHDGELYRHLCDDMWRPQDDAMTFPVAAGPWDNDPAVPEALRTERYVFRRYHAEGHDGLLISADLPVPA